MGGALNIVKSSPTKGLCSVIHMQVINIIHGQLLLAQKKRGDCIYGQQQVREERRGEKLWQNLLNYWDHMHLSLSNDL